MAELFCARGAGEHHAHDERAEASGEADPLEESITRQQRHDDAEERAQLTVPELVPAASSQR